MTCWWRKGCAIRDKIDSASVGNPRFVASVSMLERSTEKQEGNETPNCKRERSKTSKTRKRATIAMWLARPDPPT